MAYPYSAATYLCVVQSVNQNSVLLKNELTGECGEVALSSLTKGGRPVNFFCVLPGMKVQKMEQSWEIVDELRNAPGQQPGPQSGPTAPQNNQPPAEGTVGKIISVAGGYAQVIIGTSSTEVALSAFADPASVTPDKIFMWTQGQWRLRQPVAKIGALGKPGMSKSGMIPPPAPLAPNARVFSDNSPSRSSHDFQQPQSPLSAPCASLTGVFTLSLGGSLGISKPGMQLPQPQGVLPSYPQPISKPGQAVYPPGNAMMVPGVSPLPNFQEELTITNLVPNQGIFATRSPSQETINVQLREIITQENKLVEWSQIQVGMKLLATPEGPYRLVGAAPQRKAANFLDPSQFEEIYSLPMNKSMGAIKDYISSQYGALYYSRGASNSRSLSAYLFQCILLEKVLLRQKAHMETPISVQFGMMEDFPPESLSIRHPDFELRYATQIDRIEEQVARLITNSEKMDFTLVARMAKVCFLVIRPSGDLYEPESVFPDGPPDLEFQKVVLIGRPPYPVVITKKLASLLKSDMNISIAVERFIFFSQKRAPPRQDPKLLEDIQKLEACSKEVINVTETLLGLSTILTERFDRMIRERQLGDKFISTKMANEFHKLTGHLPKLNELPYKQNAKVVEYCKRIANGSRLPLNHFSSKCGKCTQQYAGWSLSCGHKLCDECAAVALSPLRCPLCGREIEKETVRANDREVFKRLEECLNNQTNRLQCSQCDNAHSYTLTYKSECGHTCCYLCARSQVAYCVICSFSLQNALLKISSQEFCCESCGQSVDFWQIPSMLCTQSHIFCTQCLFTICKQAKCICDEQFPETKVAEISNLAYGMCLGCNEWKLYRDFAKMNCSCCICLTCGNDFATRSLAYSACWNCTTPLPQQTAQLFQRHCIQATSGCPYCFQSACDMKLFCGDEVHYQCFVSYASRQLAQDPVQRVECLKCGVEVYPSFLNRCLYPQYAIPEQGDIELQCPNCHHVETYTGVNPEDVQSILNVCEKCHTKYCGLCLTSSNTAEHENCPYIHSRDRICFEERQGRQCIVCPNCRLAGVRNKEAASQTCEWCHTEFCSECVVDLKVIEAHGGSYHREDCSKHSQLLVSADQDERCPLCQFYGDHPVPKKLARRGAFPPGRWI